MRFLAVMAACFTSLDGAATRSGQHVPLRSITVRDA
jgi:hypothetical protein